MKNETIKIITNPNKNSFTSDNLGIRAGLNALGFNNNDIGWDGENVTYKNKAIFKPDRNDDGTTKINTKGFIEGVNKIYGDSGNSLADVTAYASGTGISNLVEYGGDGTVSVGGIQVPNTIIIDGQAYASANDIKKAITTAFGNSNIYSTVDVWNRNYGENGKYTEDIENLVRRLVDREEFSYNPEDDPVYQSYKDMYMRNGREAMNDTYGSLAARTGGYGNSAAIAAADNAYFSYIKALNDKIPELYRDAYDRYKNRYKEDSETLSKLGTPKDIYNFENNANRDLRHDISEAMKSDYQRNIDNRDYLSEQKELEFERDYKNGLLANEIAALEYKKLQDSISNFLAERKLDITADANSVKKQEVAIKQEESDRKEELHGYEIEKIIAQIAKLQQ